jgi:hypothetical protein
MRWISVFVILIAAWPAAQAVAGEPSDDKLAFIEARLDASRDAAGLWQNGWTAVYGSAAVAYTAMALDADNDDDRALNTIGALRAATATGLLMLRPHPGARGADPVRAVPGTNPQDRLAIAEAILRDSARRTSSKRRPARHLRNIVVNLAFGGLVWAFGDSGDVLPFTLMGIAGGEAVLLSLPEQPRRDLRDYERRFTKRALGRNLQFLSRPGGIQFRYVLGR